MIFKKTLQISLAFTFSFSTLLFSYEDSQVLPKSIFRTWFVGTFGEITSAFDKSGKENPIASEFSQNIPVAALAAQNPQLGQLHGTLNSLQAGLGDELFETKLSADVSTTFQSYNLALEYGINKKLSVGFILPMTSIQSSAQLKVKNKDNTAAVSQKVNAMPLPNEMKAQLNAGIGSVAQNLPTAEIFENALIRSNGYKAPGETNYFGVGDLEIGAKYQILNLNNEFFATTKFGLRIPTTSYQDDETNLFDASTGDGQWDAEAHLLGEWKVIPELSLQAGLSGTYQFSDSISRHTPEKGDRSPLINLTTSTKEKLSRNLGEKFRAGAALSYSFWNKKMSTGAIYTYDLKTKDNFRGSKGLDYARHEINTDSTNHRAELSLSYSTIPDYKAKKFPIPADFKLSYNNNFAGNNTSKADYVTATLKAYF